MADGKYEGLKALGSVLAGLGGLAALISVVLGLWQKEPAPTATVPDKTPNTNQTNVTAEPAPPPQPVSPTPQPEPSRRDQLLGTWNGSYGAERYTITYYDNSTYELLTEYPLFGTSVSSSGNWSFNDPHVTLTTSFSTDPFTTPAGSVVLAEILELSSNRIVVRTQLAPSITFIKR